MSFLSRIKSFVGFEPDLDEQDFMDEPIEDDGEFTVKGKVVNIHTTTRLKLLLFPKHLKRQEILQTTLNQKACCYKS